jgi:hypothetical protein
MGASSKMDLVLGLAAMRRSDRHGDVRPNAASATAPTDTTPCSSPTRQPSRRPAAARVPPPAAVAATTGRAASRCGACPSCRQEPPPGRSDPATRTAHKALSPALQRHIADGTSRCAQVLLRVVVLAAALADIGASSLALQGLDTEWFHDTPNAGQKAKVPSQVRLGGRQDASSPVSRTALGPRSRSSS